MNKQTNISPDSWPKVLKAGAFLRWQGRWHVWQLLGSDLTTQNQKENLIFGPDFFDLEKGFFRAGYRGSFEKSAILQELKLLNGNYSSVLFTDAQPWSGPSLEQFKESFSVIQSEIKAGLLKKAVPIVASTLAARFGPQDLVRCWINLCEAPDHLIPFGLWTEDEGILGATPELLFVQKDLNVDTMALAGTCPKSTGRSVEDFLKDPKENQEHVWVVQDICEKLSMLGEIKKGLTSVLELPHLYHLQTQIQLGLKQASDPTALVKTLHPTAALGVYPASYNYQKMKSWPLQSERGRFGAPILFPLEAGHFVSVVAIRSLDWSIKSEQINLRAGCGLVEQSVFESEWDELNQKIESIRKLILK